MKKYIYIDERYPTFYFDNSNWGREVDISQELWDRYTTIHKDFDDLQSELADIHEKAALVNHIL